MVVHIDVPLRWSFWLDWHTTLQSRKRLGIFLAAVKTSPERMETSSSKIGCVGEG